MIYHWFQIKDNIERHPATHTHTHTHTYKII